MIHQTERVSNPIDAFILARLEKHNLKPAPPADKRTLIRRAYFDLLGLPPTSEQVAAYVKKTNPRPTNSYSTSYSNPSITANAGPAIG